MILRSNAEELALIAQETGAENLGGHTRYPGRWSADTRYSR
jgi:hypothetical protein